MPTDCQQTELVCPLCREWFDNRTGLSNHVRGHLKRLGKPTSTASKSPVVILKELMRDKKQFQLKLQVLERKCRGSRIYQPVRLSNGLTFSSTVKQHKYIHSRSVEEKKRIETNKGSPPSDLIGILKKRRAHEETKAKCPSHTARKALSISSSRECGLEIQPFKAAPNSLAGEFHQHKLNFTIFSSTVNSLLTKYLLFIYYWNRSQYTKWFYSNAFKKLLCQLRLII